VVLDSTKGFTQGTLGGLGENLSEEPDLEARQRGEVPRLAKSIDQSHSKIQRWAG
jgi:hypothetical protein